MSYFNGIGLPVDGVLRAVPVLRPKMQVKRVEPVNLSLGERASRHRRTLRRQQSVLHGVTIVEDFPAGQASTGTISVGSLKTQWQALAA